MDTSAAAGANRTFKHSPKIVKHDAEVLGLFDGPGASSPSKSSNKKQTMGHSIPGGPCRVQGFDLVRPVQRMPTAPQGTSPSVQFFPVIQCNVIPVMTSLERPVSTEAR